MSEYNIVEQIVRADAPKIIPDEVLHVYVPKVGEDNPGIALFDENDFIIQDGKVYFRYKYVKHNDLTSSVYITDSDGNDDSIEYSEEPFANTIVKRDNGGKVHTADPVSDTDAVNKKYHEETLGDKLTKVTTSGSLRAYGVSDTGDQITLPATLDPIRNSLVYRDANGRAKIQTPIDDEQIANKKYVDDKEVALTEYVDNKETALNERINNTKADLELIIGEVESIAKGANQALSFANYREMINLLNKDNSIDKREYITGQNIYIQTPSVPDLWVYYASDTYKSYTYVSDDVFEEELKTNNWVKVGYYLLAPLETQKVDLTEYPKKDEVDIDIQTAKDDVVHYVNDEYYKSDEVDQAIATAKQEAITSILTLYPNLDEEVF